MDKVHSYLLDWAINFVKNRDAFTKKIKEIEKGKDSDFSVRYDDGKEASFIIIPSIDDIQKTLEKRTKKDHFCIITLNNKDNLDSIINNWKKLIEYEFLSIYFVNPDSKLDKKWILFPYTHNKICDESSLKSGLKSMFEMVEQISEGQLKLSYTHRQK
jgi:hypothetical protein